MKIVDFEKTLEWNEIGDFIGLAKFTESLFNGHLLWFIRIQMFDF